MLNPVSVSLVQEGLLLVRSLFCLGIRILRSLHLRRQQLLLRIGSRRVVDKHDECAQAAEEIIARADGECP